MAKVSISSNMNICMCACIHQQTGHGVSTDLTAIATSYYSLCEGKHVRSCTAAVSVWDSSVCGMLSESLITVHCHIMCRPVYPVEQELSTEIMEEESSEMNLICTEEQTVEEEADFEEEEPVFLDFAGLSSGRKELKVLMW